MHRRTRVIMSAVSVAAIAGGIAGGAVAATGGGDDNERPITGEALDRASQAALAFTSGGTVTETEQGDEDAFYEVEVTLPDSSQVDVHLDEQFVPVNAEADDDSTDDNDGDE